MDGKIEPVFCELQYSGAVRAVLAAAALATALVAAALPWSAALRAFTVLGVAALALRAHRELFAARWIRVDGEGAVLVARRDGRLLEGRLVDGSFVAPWLTIVRWRPARGRIDRTTLIGPGMAQAEPARRLRVRLRAG